MAVTINGDGVVDVGGNASSAAYVRLYEDSDNGTNYVDLIAPASVTSNRTLDLPDASGTIDRLNRAGNVLQVVSAATGTDTTITATSYTDITNLSVSITPTSASSKILVLVQLSGRYYTQATTDRVFSTNIVRGSTQIHEISSSDLASGVGSGSFTMWPVLSSLIYLDSPATTSSTTYKCQGKISNSASTTAMAFNANDGVSTITLMEIAA